MKLLIVDDEYIAVEGVMNGVNWDALGFEQVFQAYSYSEAVEILQKPMWRFWSVILKCRTAPAWSWWSG